MNEPHGDWMLALRADVRWMTASGLLIAACAGCGVGERRDVQRDLAQARALWRAQGLHHYTMTVETLCPDEFVNPTEVVVRDGEVVDAYMPGTTQRVTYVLNRETALTDRDVQDCFYTVDELFDLIEQVVSQRPYAYSVTAEFDDTLGYPTHIAIDAERLAHDDVYIHDVTLFNAVESSGLDDSKGSL